MSKIADNILTTIVVGNSLIQLVLINLRIFSVIKWNWVIVLIPAMINLIIAIVNPLLYRKKKR